MRYREILEAPLDGYELHGDWSDQETHDPQPVITGDNAPSAEYLRKTHKGNSFVSKFDRALIQKPETEAAVRRYFARFRLPIHLFFLNAEDGLQIANHFIDFGDLENPEEMNPDNRLRSTHARIWELLGPEISERVRQIRAEQPDACVIILTHNEGGPKRHPLTPWMIVHRIAHATTSIGNVIETKYELQVVADAYGISLKHPTPIDHVIRMRFEVSRAISTFRAARENNILNNSPIEFGAELFTQLVIQGRIKFQLPDEIGGHAIDPAKRPQAMQALKKLEAYVNEFYGETEQNMRGKVYVC